MADPVEKAKGLAAEAQRGRSDRTPLLAIGGVTLVVGVVVGIVLAVALVLYFTLGGK